MKRIGAMLVALLGTACAVLLVSSASAEPGVGDLTLTVTGPTDVMGIPAPRYVISATIANNGGSTATGLTISSSFPDSDAREEITGVTGCDDSGLNLDVCSVADIPGGQSRVVTFRYAPTEYGIDRHHLVTASTGLGTTDDADYDVRVSWPPGSTDWRVQVTPAVGMSGLRARHEVVVTNLGPATATNVVLDEQLLAGEQLLSTSLGSGCSLQTATVLHCSLGTLAGRASFTLLVDTKLPANPGDAFHVVDIGSDTPSVSAAHLFGSAPASGDWRYWMCAQCASTTFSDDYVLPSTFTVAADETVHVSDGSVVRRDGVLARTDGKFVLTDGTIAAPLPLPPPPGPPTGIHAAATDGQAAVSFDEPPAGGLPVTSYTVTANPGGYVYRGTSSPITALGLANGTSYTFTVSASNGAGPGSASVASNPVTPIAVPAPGTGVTAVRGDKQATVSFSPSPSSSVAYYTATAFPGGKSTNGTTSPITVSGLKNGVSYTFSVHATNSSGAGPESEYSNAVVPSENPRPDAEPPRVTEPRVPTPAPPPAAGPRPGIPGH